LVASIPKNAKWFHRRGEKLYWISLALVPLHCGFHVLGFWLIRRFGQEIASGSQALAVVAAITVVGALAGIVFVTKAQSWLAGVTINMTAAYLLLALLIGIFIFQWLNAGDPVMTTIL
jgi:hypothetical protein